MPSVKLASAGLELQYAVGSSESGRIDPSKETLVLLNPLGDLHCESSSASLTFEVLADRPWLPQISTHNLVILG